RSAVSLRVGPPRGTASRVSPTTRPSGRSSATQAREAHVGRPATAAPAAGLPSAGPLTDQSPAGTGGGDPDRVALSLLGFGWRRPVSGETPPAPSRTRTCWRSAAQASSPAPSGK